MYKAAFENILVYGATWCPDAKRARQFFDSHGIPYTWIDIDQDPEAKAYVNKVNGGKVVIPTIVFKDGSMLIEPSDQELSAKFSV